MTRQHSDLGRTSGQNQPPYQRPPPPARQNSDLKPPAASSSNLETSRAMSGSVSWLEWTQQLQAYIAWVNSQLRKRTELSAVQDLRTDLQSGEVLAQLIEIICKYWIGLFCFVGLFLEKSQGKTEKYFDIDWFIWHPNTKHQTLRKEIKSHLKLF